MRLSGVLALLGLVALLVGVSASSGSTTRRVVPCADIIDSTSFPYPGDRFNRYRQVLGAVAVPPAYMGQIVPTGQEPWAYWRKQGLVIRATGQPVTITVPQAWRTRVAINWGNQGGGYATIRVAGCRSSAKTGNAYAGGFYITEPSACVPLIFTVGARSVTMRFGLGKRC